MNHLTARCGCGAIVTLPSLKARAYSAKCEACLGRERAAVVAAAPKAVGGAVRAADDVAARRQQAYAASTAGFMGTFSGLFDAHINSGPPGCECPPCAERRAFVEALCGFAARLAEWDPWPNGMVVQVQQELPKPGEPVYTITAIDHERGVITMDCGPTKRFEGVRAQDDVESRRRDTAYMFKLLYPGSFE